MIEKVEPVIETGWKKVMQDEFNQDYFRALKFFLLEEKKKYRIFPQGQLIFNAFNRTPFDQVKVVLLGQDPYHGAGQAHGLCFSVPDGVQKPPSLVNILKELKSDLGFEEPVNGNLTKWADQGVLLLNATLTVRENQAGSHQHRGWETFTDAAISQLSQQRDGLVFILWGNYAGAKRSLIDPARHFILSSVHPSPLSAHRGFFGCHHFSQVNNFLKQRGIEEIDWRL
ncbi:MAG: uracil-DNA glycosylase [Bacteroidetes bacterium]|nr:uracil-DNA glycosylase [Bacteroidota bacterium]